MCRTAFFLIIGIIWLCQKFNGVKSLKCKCDICRDSNYTCETDGYCFTSIHQHKVGSIEHSYSCLNRRNYFPPEQPRWCSQPSTTKSARLCCDEHDMCNADLRPQLAFSPDSVLSEGIAG
ncbi:hypothetical protein ILUMI_07415 [Ignelater luminosus]|uniref:Activin types I and II receptor domain-containing protein n=1 Tax=Ignelater luminosus TaxID=2038154 RepID=A0A8K0D8V4_IGNLU|nr:hypothetical protein ILUMI_07415 [Ignelater luminosus]